jgi:phosphoketolase
MDTKDILDKLNSIISNLEDKGLFTEAEKLQKEFTKLTKKVKERFLDEPAQAIIDKFTRE